MRALAKNINVFIIMCIAGITAGCKDNYNSQVSYIKDGQIILLNSGNIVAAVKITAQSQNPEVVSYEYIYRLDGNMSFENSQKEIIRGKHTERPNISFGPIVLGWSVEKSGGEGWVYFDVFPGGSARPSKMKFELAKTNEFNGITDAILAEAFEK